MSERRIGFYPVRTTWKVVLRERSTRHFSFTQYYTPAQSHEAETPRAGSHFASHVLCDSLFVSIIDHEKDERNEKRIIKKKGSSANESRKSTTNGHE